MKSLILTSLSMLIFVPNAIAVHDNNFRECLTKKIYKDCEKI